MDRSLRLPFAVGLLLVVLTALTNIGFIALDDYEYNVAVVVPAERHNPQSILAAVDFRPPLASLLLHGIAQVGAKLGVVTPTGQFRWVLLVIGLFSYLVVFASAQQIAPPEYRRFTAWGVATYFLMPLLLTRSMFEALSIPYLMASVALATAYFKKPRFSVLVLSLIFLALGSLFRFHIGICGVVLPFLAFWVGRPPAGHTVGILVLAWALFALTGVPDLFLKGEWHASLKGYLAFNAAYSHTFGTTPFYTYGLLLLGVTLPPALFSRYRNFPWLKTYLPYYPALLYLAVFVGAHSFVGHKEERFMIPILPLWLLLCVPLVQALWSQPWRRYYLLGLNGILLVLVSFTEPQRNIIELARYLDLHPEMERIVAVEDSLVLFPKAFIRKVPAVKESTLVEAQAATGCDPVVVREGRWQALGWRELGRFSPGLLEGWMVKANPRHNARRGTLELWQRAECPVGKGS